jgi:hypothetical protein
MNAIALISPHFLIGTILGGSLGLGVSTIVEKVARTVYEEAMFIQKKEEVSAQILCKMRAGGSFMRNRLEEEKQEKINREIETIRGSSTPVIVQLASKVFAVAVVGFSLFALSAVLPASIAGIGGAMQIGGVLGALYGG